MQRAAARLGLWCALMTLIKSDCENTTALTTAVGESNATTTVPPTHFGKPTKFDENTEDLVYVDQKDVMDMLLLAQKGLQPIKNQPPEGNRVQRRRKRAAKVWQVRRYVRFPGQRPPWELARSPRLVFREHEPSLQAPWAHNSILEDNNQGKNYST